MRRGHNIFTGFARPRQNLASIRGQAVKTFQQVTARRRNSHIRSPQDYGYPTAVACSFSWFTQFFKDSSQLERLVCASLMFINMFGEVL